MTITEILSRIKWALNEIQAEIDLVDFEDECVKPLCVISIASQQFLKMPVYSRTFWVDELIALRDPILHATIELAYECFTFEEKAVGLQRKYELH